MTRPTRQTAHGRAYLDLQNQARREKRPTQELFVLYVLERWLARLAESTHCGSFVLKGGLLLAVFDARRPTADADLLARNLTNDHDIVAGRVQEIAQVVLAEDDGVRFLTETITMSTIREDADYAGVRVAMDCRVAAAKVKLKLDINVGDPVTPAPNMIELPSQRPGLPGVRVLGYPIETVLAEKSSTAIALGDTNTRVRDYADIYTLTADTTCPSRPCMKPFKRLTITGKVQIRPLSDVIGALATLRQDAYDAFRRRLGAEHDLPESLADVTAAVIRFVDPLAAPEGSATTWVPAAREWR